MAALVFLWVPAPGRALDPVPRSVSRSRQFVVYSADARLRMAVASYVETAKQDVLETFGVGDHWKFPIVIDLKPAVSTDSKQPLSRVSLVETEGGWKVQIDVVLREGEFKTVRLPQAVIRAILLELACREHPPTIGAPYTEPPSWLLEALVHNMQTRATGTEPNAALFRQLIETGNLPKIRDFLTNKVEVMDATSLAVYSACASSLLEMLVATPDGKASLTRMVKGLGDSDGDAVAQLLKHFPALGGSEAALEKWWTLGLARYSILDSHLARTVPETDARLTAILKLTLVTDEKKGTKEDYTLADYKTFLKHPGAKAVLYEQCNALGQLMTQAHPLLRPVVLEYQRIAIDLARGKTRRMDGALRSIEEYRGLIVDRMDKISDYMNWYEATQVTGQSGAFEDFLKAGREMEKATPPKRNDAISNYLDQVQREFE